MLNEIATIIKITTTTKTNDKIAIIKENDSENLRDLFYYAFNDFCVFGVKNVDFTRTQLTGYNPKKHQEFINILKMLMTTSVNNEVRKVLKDFLESCNQPQQDIYYQIIQKDLVIGASAKTVNKALGFSFIPMFSLMACEPYEEQDLNTRKLVQKKYDGYRCLIVKNNTTISCFSRNGNVIPLVTIPKELSKVKGSFVLDGELVSNTRTSTSGVCNSLIKGNKTVDDSSLVFYAFDFLDYTEFTSEDFKTPCEDRVKAVEVMCINNNFKHIVPSTTYETETVDEVLALYKRARELGEEGIIVKDPKSLYETRRSQSWLKLKAINSCTLQVIDKYEHKNGNALGGFICQSLNGELTVNVGGGFSDEDRETFWKANMQGKCVEVLYNEVQVDKHGKEFLFLPRFKEVRIDKYIPDSLEVILKESK